MMRRLTARISALLIAAGMTVSGAGGVNVLAADQVQEADSGASAPDGAAAAADTVKGKITVDGSLDDWTAVPEQKSTDGEIAWWKTARDSSGNLYLCFTGNAQNPSYGNYDWKYLSISCEVEHPYWTEQKDKGFQITNTENTTGGSLVTVNEANTDSPAPYYVELMVPSAYVSEKNVKLTFAGTTLAWNDIPVLDGTDATPKEDTTYHGITIDGNFKDWAGVTKYDASCPNPAHLNCIEKAAMVLDGDTVYLYVKEKQGGSAAGAGTHSNGNFAITTDLGHTLLLHFHKDGTVTSAQASGITSRHVGTQWEAAVPARFLPRYQNTINFGLYATDSTDPKPFVKNVSNLNGSSGNAGKFNGSITYDGQYDDWLDYPHALIEYATAGTQADQPDGEGAIYCDGKNIYGHVYTEMPAHLNEHGGELGLAQSSITIRVNRNDNEVFYPRLISVDSQGKIDWNPTAVSSPGTREFYLVDTQGGHDNIHTLDDLKKGDRGNRIYGKLTMTLDSSKRDECEYYIDVKALADRLGIDANDIQYVEQRFGRIGQQWIGTAGTSTFPFLGVGICIASVAAAVLVLRKKYRADQPAADGAGLAETSPQLRS